MDNFMQRFARKMGCTVHLQSGQEFSSIGASYQYGNACANCGDCTRAYGNLGMASEGVYIINSAAGGLQLSWACPGCGRETVEDTTALNTFSLAEACKADPWCATCRKSGKH